MRKQTWMAPVIVFGVTSFAGAALADPAAPTQTSPGTDAGRHIAAACTEIGTAFTPKGAKAGLAKAAQRIRRGYHDFMAVAHAPTPMR